jgi:hypothetical protein
MFVVQFFDVLPPVNVFLSYCSENGGIILRVMLKNMVLIYIFTLKNHRKAGVGKSPNQSFLFI